VERNLLDILHTLSKGVVRIKVLLDCLVSLHPISEAFLSTIFMSHTTLEEARASGRIVEYESAGVTYSYAGTPSNTWIDGHDWANPRTIEERTASTDTSKTTKSWLLAQCLWWDLWKPGVECPRSITKADLAATLYNKIMGGGVRWPLFM
jgi:hypothetical protein